jgi:hypothetical protein
MDLFIFGYLLGTVPYGLLLLKGRVAMFFAALVVSIIPVVGVVFAVVVSLRLAKPNSWWARHRYDRETMNRARDRYSKAPTTPATTSAVFGGLILALGPIAVAVRIAIAVA